MIELLIIPIMGVLSAWSGGSLWPSQHLPKRLTWLPEAAFALVCASPYLWLPGYWWLTFFPVALWVYAWQQSSPAPALHWGTEHYNPDKESTLKPFVDAISPWHPSTKNYCRLYIAIKGLLITLPVGGLGLIGYPLAYELGNRTKNHAISEGLAGASAGLSAYLFMILSVWN